MKKLWEGITDYIDDIILLSWEMKLLFGLIMLTAMSSIFPQLKALVRIGWILFVALPICLYELLTFVERIKQKQVTATGIKKRKKKNRLLKLLEKVGTDIFGDMLDGKFVVHMVFGMVAVALILILKVYEMEYGVVTNWLELIAHW